MSYVCMYVYAYVYAYVYMYVCVYVYVYVYVHVSQIPKYRRLTALRSLVARNVESLVLMDRLAYLLQHDDVSWAGILHLFDPHISPRSFAMIASRE